MSNRHYRNLAHQAVNIMNEEQEAYVESPSLPANLPPQADNNAERGNSAANSGESDQARVPASDQAIAANAENLDRVDGYDEVFDQNVSADFECPICMLVLRNPVQTGCGHRFCGACINRHLANVHTCPIDNQQLDPSEINADNFAKREIYMLRVKCRTVKNEKECPWIGCLKDVEEHLKTCPFVEAPCPKGCNQNVERKALDHHLKKECPKRTTTCTHCKTEVLHKNYKDHYGKCQKVVVPCPNCKQKMLREKLVAGHEKECPKGQAVCDFKSYGCKWTGQRFNLQNHLNNEIQLHLSMLCAALAVLLPQNGKEKSKGAASGGASASANGNGTVSATVLEEFNRQRNKNTEAIATLEAKLVEMERKYRELRGA